MTLLRFVILLYFSVTGGWVVAALVLRNGPILFMSTVLVLLALPMAVRDWRRG